MSDELDIDKLLEIASNPGTKTDQALITDPYHLDIRKFIRSKNIQTGTQPVHARHLFDFYYEWSDKPLTYKRFVKYLSIYCKKVRSSSHVLFKIDPTCLGLPDYYSFYSDIRFTKKLKKTSFVGVYPIANYFIARFKTEEATHYLGRFKTAKEAAREYDKYAYLHFGTTTQLNFPENKDVYDKELTEKK